VLLQIDLLQIITHIYKKTEKTLLFATVLLPFLRRFSTQTNSLFLDLALILSFGLDSDHGKLRRKISPFTVIWNRRASKQDWW
jgi:hypothetical protein